MNPVWFYNKLEQSHRSYNYQNRTDKLVQSKSLEEATCEDSSNFTIQFPEFNLEDKVVSEEGCTVRNGENTEMKGELPLQVYNKRTKGAKL